MEIRSVTRDYSLLVPLLTGILSLLGICLIFSLTGFRGQETPPPTQTVTPFKYALLATETIVPTSTLLSETPTSIGFIQTATSEANRTLLLSVTGQTGVSENEISTPTLAITLAPIFTASVPMTAGTYDAGNSQIIRDGNWATQKNDGAYEGTLLVSNKVGNYVAFRFVGYRIALGYQGSDNAGELTVNIDGSEDTFAQETGTEWFSQELESGTHFVILTHEYGNSLNLDYVVIIE